MRKAQLFEQIKKKSSFLCIGLDADIRRIPRHLLREKDPLYAFNRQIIDATADLCVAYKPNVAFYESMGSAGWEALQKTAEYMPDDVLRIADAKRGDIGNTSQMYARTFFEQMSFDAVTVAPYMGSDSVDPFLQYEDKWVILLALTSNKGAHDFQTKILHDGQRPLFEEVIRTSSTWASAERLMYVVGATRTTYIERVRAAAPDHFLLVPGVGAQGGDLQQVVGHGINRECGLLVNASRSIIYAGDGKDYARAAREAAMDMQRQMDALLLQSEISGRS